MLIVLKYLWIKYNKPSKNIVIIHFSFFSHISKSRIRHDFYKAECMLCSHIQNMIQNSLHRQHASILWIPLQIPSWYTQLHLSNTVFNFGPFERKYIRWWAWRTLCITFSCHRILFTKKLEYLEAPNLSEYLHEQLFIIPISSLTYPLLLLPFCLWI